MTPLGEERVTRVLQPLFVENEMAPAGIIIDSSVDLSTQASSVSKRSIVQRLSGTHRDCRVLEIRCLYLGGEAGWMHLDFFRRSQLL